MARWNTRTAPCTATGRAERDVSADLRGAILPPKTTHRVTITDPVKVGQLLRVIDSYDGYAVVAYALKLAPLTFVRPGELRGAEWAEFSFDKAEWRIPAGRMKMKEQHIVPLARQALEILDVLRNLNGHGKYLFPSVRTDTRFGMCKLSLNGVTVPALFIEQGRGHKPETVAGHIQASARLNSSIVKIGMGCAGSRMSRASRARLMYSPNASLYRESSMSDAGP